MAIEQVIYNITLEAQSDLSAKQFYAMKGSEEFGCDVAGAADEDCIGVLQNNPNASTTGIAASVMRVGITKVKLGDAATVWDELTPDADGKLVPAGSGEKFICRALEAGADNAIISALMEFGRVA